jgi:hypothetical protein
MSSYVPTVDAPAGTREHAIFVRAAWRILPALMFGWMFCFVDRINIGFAQLQMAGDLGFSGQAEHVSNAQNGFAA